MIVSMTAFGRQEDSGDWGHAIWEIKTVNHRYLEIGVRLPDDLRQLENGIREHISARLSRGKVDCTLRYDRSTSTSNAITINAELAGKLIQAAESLPISAPAPLNPVDILRWPDILQKEALDADVLAGPLLALLDTSLDALIATRQREGEKIHAMIRDRCIIASTHVNVIRKELPALMESIRERIMTRAQELSANLENDRLEQEMVLLTQKLDVAEELDRLQAHIEEVNRVLDEDSPVGRRLDFLMQEMNREANTLGSKAASIDMTNASVELKVLIEQMREQIQNIE